MEAELDELSKLVHDIQFRNKDLEYLALLKLRLEVGLEYLTSFVQSGSHYVFEELLVNMTVLHRVICREVFDLEKQKQTCLQAEKAKTNRVGRPKYLITKETLLNLRDIGYTWIEISNMLLVSRWTIQRRVKEFNIGNLVSYTEISDDELDSHVRAAKDSFGISTGRSIITGYLKSLGLRLQRERIMKSLVRVDPSSSRLRWACLIKRRKYTVPGPNSLWHADGHHSLITWGFVIHGAIDGFSRLIVYLKCSTNNKAQTVLEQFNKATERFGVPSRIRTDKGGENQLLWEKMEELRGPNRGSYIAGSSVHNQRIERLWRDVWACVSHVYYYTFQALEVEGVLNINDAKHMYILHYVYQPRINHTIAQFVDGWNKHPLRTEKNRSPEKLWTTGMLDNRLDHLIQVAEMQDVPLPEDLVWYGYDPDAPHPTDVETNNVDVDDFECPFDEEDLQIVLSIDPLRQSSVYGTDIFTELLEMLSLL